MSSLSEKMVPVKIAQELKNNWNNNQAKAIEDKLGFEDVSDFLFKLEDLQEYLDLVKKQSEEQGIKNPGVRVFFGAYAESKRATLFLSATEDFNEGDKQEEVKNNYEIEPLNTITGGFPPFVY